MSHRGEDTAMQHRNRRALKGDRRQGQRSSLREGYVKRHAAYRTRFDPTGSIEPNSQ
jgi:hypothetical protein